MTTTNIFTMSNEPTLHFTDDDPEPVTAYDRGSLLIFTGPHNGHAVPACLPECLGTEADWFSKAHEAADLHMDSLFESMMDTMPDTSFIYGNYSRLVCDLNAKPDSAITLHSSEYKDFKIPNNQPDQCCDNQRERRLNALYHPYHNTKTAMIERARANHNGGVIVLDMHSFTPTWLQTQRDVEVGTLRHEKTPLSEALEAYLKDQDEYRFVSGEPYRVSERPHNAATLIMEKNNLQYLGLEIRNDLIATPEGVAKMTAFVQGCVDHLLAHPDLKQLSAPRSGAMEKQMEDAPSAS